jgi:predicted nucleotidyltransferase
MEKRMNSNSALDQLIKELDGRKDVLGAAIFGSWALGRQRRDSDIDVFILIKTGVRRDVERRGGTNFEFVYVSYDEAMKFYQANPDDCVQLWKDAQVIFDKSGHSRS